jgi:hypothetical protein
MPEDVFGFSRTDAGRLARTNRTVEGMVEHITRRRGRYPIGVGGKKRIPVYITTDDGSGNPVPIYRGSHVLGFQCKRELTDTDTITVYTDLMKGCAFTGQQGFIERVTLNTALGSRYYWVSDTADQWAATANEDIAPTGDVSIGYWRDDTGAQADCTVEAELFNTSSPIAGSGDCWVMFRQNFSTFEDPTTGDVGTRFVAIPRNCPDYQAEE